MSDTANHIAVVGIAGRFPGADDVAAFWRLLCDGTDAVGHFSDQELEHSNAAALPGVRHVNARGVLARVDEFDAEFFGIPPREAELMDPQHRLFLQCAWHALEDAGRDPAAFPGLIGVYAGVSLNTYLLYNLQGHGAGLAGSYQVGAYHTMLGNDKDFMPTRVSYKLGLRGPSMAVQSACSTSLVAVAQACQALLSFQADLCLAGGASISFPQKRDYPYAEDAMVSPDGRCRPFDAEAQGTVFGHGVGVVALRRLDDALAEGDRILAVIRGSAVNNDGAGKVGFAAPSVDGQAAVIAMAQALAEVDPASISYIEAHGTGTPLGDPIEVAALTQAFRRGTAARQFCTIGTGKGHIGHLDVAAGVTGLIKTVLQLQHRQIPPVLHFTSPNPKIDLATSPFRIAQRLAPWNGPRPLRAGVSAFGVGGTNAHVVLEEAPAQEPLGGSRPHQLLVWSARTGAALDAATARLAAHLRANDLPLADVAYTLQVGRRAFKHRRIAVCDGPDGAVRLLSTPGRLASAICEGPATVAFLFPGQGAQHAGMAAGIYRSEPAFRAEIDRLCALAEPHLGFDLRTVLFPAAAAGEAHERLRQTEVAQPALFIVSLALARLWQAWGVTPQAYIGHSVGEYVAATLSGIMGEADALRLVALRGRLIQGLPPGTMLSVRLAEAELLPLLPSGCSIAAVNGPQLCVASGPVDAIAALEVRLAAAGTVSRPLRTSHAFHSPMMDAVLPAFAIAVGAVHLTAPNLPIVSSVSGTWLTAAEATDPQYWVRHVRATVRFADAATTLRRETAHLFLEVGPGRTLVTLARQAAGDDRRPMIPSLPTPAEAAAGPGAEAEAVSDTATLMEALGRLWLAGVPVGWSGLHAAEPRRRVGLPGYPFATTRYWIAPPAGALPLPTACPAAAVGALPPEDERSPTMASAPHPPAPAAGARRAALLAALRGLLGELSGTPPERLDPAANFLELGFDSLLLTQVSMAMQSRFKAKVTFRQLLGDLASLDAVADHLDRTLPPEAFAPAAALPAPAPAARSGQAPASANESLLEQTIRRQMELMSEQLALLRGGAQAPASAMPALAGSAQAAPAQAAPPMKEAEFKAFGPYKPIQRGPAGGLGDRQQAALDQLIARYTAKTAKSKALTQLHRPHLADPRVAAGFRAQWKEMVYPIITSRSKGTRLWDVDGNEYIDLLNGFGCILFGHAPDFVVEAVNRQLQQGFEIGPQTLLAGEAAQLMCEMTGLDRATFSNTGSEAVMAAMRLARTVTGRMRIVSFLGDYHGTFDEVLAKSVGADHRSLPIAPGIPQGKVDNLTVLPYGTDESLAWIRAHADELAAVLIEPVQSRHPALQPKAFIQEVRAITAASGAALIMDEVITGFRSHPGGAQALFGVKADLASYGKVIGGGMPIGVLCGTSRFMDALDGGMWQYGDDSFPEVGVTFFAGTFVRHPATMAAVVACLRHLKEQGGALQAGVNAKCSALAARLNALFSGRGFPTTVEHFSSWFYFTFAPEHRLGSLLYYLLRERGVHIQEGFPCFLTTAHTDAELDQVYQAFADSVDELIGHGFFPEPSGRANEHERDQSLASTTTTTASHLTTPGSTTSAPLSENQREIWLAAGLGEAASCAYNESVTLRLQGDLVLPALEQAWDALVERHPALRARFSADGSAQHFVTGLRIPLQHEDWSLMEGAARDARLQALLRHEGETPFDLEQGPAIRASVLRLGRHEHALVITAHHLVCDGWSMNVLCDEWARLYTARCTGQAPALGATTTYADYIRWQAEQAATPEHAAATAYWRGRFHDVPDLPDLPTDRPRPLLRAHAGATTRRRIGVASHQALKQAAARHRATLFTTLLSGFQALLWRLSGQDDVVVGVPTAGQALMGEAGDFLVGHCVNFLPLRARIDGTQALAAQLPRLQQGVLESFAHQNYTYGTLVAALPGTRDPSRLPLTEVQFNLERWASGVSFHGLEATFDANDRRHVVFDLFLNVVESAQGLLLVCDYNRELFDEATIQRWLGHYETLLEGLVAEPTLACARLPLLTRAERAWLVAGCNDTAVRYPPPELLHQLIAEQVARTPDAPAVSFGGTVLSFRELDRRANHLAHALQRAGVGREVLVAVCAERSLELVVALVAVLKAGGAYLPIDPDYPAERLAFMLGDAAPPVLLTQSHLVQRLPAHAAQVLLLDRPLPPALPGDDADPASATGPGDMAYVIYTSGSTGRPKGAINTHRGICNRLRWMQAAYQLGASDCVLQKTTFSFDVSVWEFFWPLMTGARLEVAPPGIHYDPVALAGHIARTGVTVMHFVPSMLQLFVDEAAAGACTSLRAVVASGEALSFELQERFFARLPSCALHNLYGPTEASVDVTAWTCRPGDPLRAVPIGFPIANTSIHLLDALLQPVPLGVPGELYIGGIGVGRGYLNRPELTAERFVPDPFSRDPAARLYRTGDLARRRGDGAIDYLGRLDHQVKIRGLRIELGEIEAAALALTQVRECAVIARNAGADQQLVAYVVMGGDQTFDPDAARAALQQRLPAYMVPAAFVVLAALPLNANGKLDRKALPAPEAGDLRAIRRPVPPQSADERTLVAIWNEVLGRDDVGIEDDLFALGGHSLLIYRIAHSSSAAGLACKPRDLFQFRTISAFLASRSPDEALLRAAGKRAGGTIAPVERSDLRTLPALPRLGPVPVFPASSAQERIWFLERLTPGTTTYSIFLGIRLNGPLSLPHLQSACDTLVARHEALRTVFLDTDGPLLQAVLPAAGVALPISDLSGVAAGADQARLDEVAQQESARLFDLERGPLIRFRLVRFAPERHALLACVHHAICDGTSLAVLFRELSLLYNGQHLDPVGLQQPDLVAWQRGLQHGDERQRQSGFWRDHLRGALPLDLATDHPRPAVQRYRGAVHHALIPQSVVAGLQRLTGRHGATPFMGLLAAFQVLLARYARQDDITVGIPVSGRTIPDLEPVVGMLVNTIPVRCDLSGDPTLETVLSRVRDEQMLVLAHQDIPFDAIVEAAQVPRDLSRSPVFQTMIAYQDDPVDALRFNGLTARQFSVDSTTAKLDLTLYLERHDDDSIAAAWEYDTDLFEPATIARLERHYLAVLRALIDTPVVTISAFPLLTAAERAWLVAGCNDTAVRYPPPELLHQLIAEQVARTPDAPAVSFGATVLSFRELDRRANHLAHALQRAGVGREVLVAVCAERSLELVVALVAVLKAGGAYLPIDPDYPAERLAFMLGDAAPPVLLTQSHLVQRLPAHAAQVLLLDRPLPPALPGDDADPASATGPGDMAYVIYTSGSTGRPKGAINTHRGICNRLRWMQAAYQLGASDCVLQKTTFSFDVSVWEFFWPLMTGARLEVAPPGIHYDPVALAGHIARTGVTVMHFVPSMLQLFVDEAAAGACTSLRAVVASGEALSFELQERFFARLPACALHNLYGPTEASVDVTAWTCRPGDPLRTVPIGFPIANTGIHLLDALLQPVPLGVPGELYIGGIGVGRGYLNRPELTAERFIPDPFSRDPAARLYRTGDLARRRGDGAIDYLGRLDHQVKIRGLRIELGEIEAAALALPQVRECAVIARNAGADQQLVAYVVMGGDQAFDPDAARAALQQRLPAYMVPAAFVVLAALPLNANGKLDRKALPAPEAGDLRASRRPVPPQSADERTLAAIWNEVLGRDDVGIEDDLFALGGHSLLIYRISHRASAIGLACTPRDLFLHRTISAFLASRAAGDAEPRTIGSTVGGRVATVARSDLRTLPALPRLGPVPVFPASSAQERIWFMERLSPGTTTYSIFFGMRLGGPLSLPDLQHACDTLVARHEALRTVFFSADETLLQAVLPTAAVALPISDLSGVAADADQARLDEVAQQESARLFDLERGPLIRFRLVRFAPERHALLACVHHAICDGTSLAVLFRELSLLYNGQHLDPVGLQQPDLVAWQRGLQHGDERQRQSGFWRDHLRGALPLDLATDHPRPAVQRYRGAVHHALIPQSVVAGLQRLTGRHGATPFMGLLAAFQVLLARYARQDDITVGIPVSGRTIPDLEPVVGMLVNTIPVRCDLSGDPTLETVLSRVRDEQMLVLAHQDIPFDAIVEAAQVPRDLSRSPVFQTMIAYQDDPVDALRFNGLTARQFSVDSTTAKLDLTLYLERHDDDSIAAAWEYDTDLFEPATIARLERHYLAVLRALIDTPVVTISAIPLLTAAERRQIVTDWNRSERSYPRDRCVHELVLEQAARSPERIAAVADGRQLTYGEMAQRITLLAAQLRARGIGPGSLVAVCVPRSLDLPVALLGVLAAGAAYIPLDAQYPVARIAQIIADARPALVLTQGDEWRPFVSAAVPEFALDAGWERLPLRAQENAPRTPSAEDLAYVIYTSGSTGRPKGVQIPHRAAVNFLCSMRATPGFQADDRLVAVTTISFDIAVLELFTPLITGARVVIADRETSADGGRLAALLDASRATHFQATPATMRLLLEAGWEGSPHVKLLCGGEAISRELANRLLPLCAELWNMYGPTETTVWSSADRVEAGDGPVLIGTPIANTRFHILAQSRQPQPIGVVGDLFIGGDGLARGYVNLPEQTADRFIVDPFDPSRRIYATGDVARYRPDGRIEFLGRSDHQVKIRGFRIELGDIEAALAEHPSVRECVVIARSHDGDQQLIAYLVAHDPDSFSADLVRTVLRDRLPPYMMPAAIVALPTLPRTANGKLDRKALPDVGRITSIASATPPASAMEKLVAGIWKAVLGVPHPGREDDFFSLGGHSLLVMKVRARLLQELGINVQFSAFFQFSQLSMLASHLDSLQGDDLETMLAEIEGLSDAEAEARALAPDQGTT